MSYTIAYQKVAIEEYESAIELNGTRNEVNRQLTIL